MVRAMDRRQRRTREAIFSGFSELLSQKEFTQITVGEIIAKADVGRATFYAHFETKDYLLKAFCEELFCHIFDTANNENDHHRHIFTCDGADSVFLHLFQHFQKNDNNLLRLLSSQNNELFLKFFKENLERLIDKQPSQFVVFRNVGLPESFWKNHITSAFVETLKWWIDNGMRETPEEITSYFLRIVTL